MPKRKTTGSGDEKPEMYVMEKGHIYWFYRAKLDVQKPQDIDDVQRMYMLLSPESGRVVAGGSKAKTEKSGESEEGSTSKQEESSAAAAAGGVTESEEEEEEEQGTQPFKPVHRLLIVGAKTMPKPIKSHGKATGFGPRDTRHFAFVDIISEKLEEIDEVLGKGTESVSMKHGERKTEAARPVGEGLYELIRYGDNLTYLAYVLEVPKEPGWPQQEFNIGKEGRILLEVKNPLIRTTKTSQVKKAGLSASSVAKFPEHLQAMFKGKRVKERRFISPPTPEFFNYHHAEFLLIATSDDLEKFGEIGRQLEAEESEEEEEIDTKFDGHSEQKLLQDLKAESTELAKHVEAVKEDPKWA